MIDIHFSVPEMTILKMGLKYNIHSKPKNCLETLALEAETTITQLPPPEREVYRKLNVELINTLRDNNQPSRTQHTHAESKIKDIKMKISDNNAMVTRADKGDSLVILNTELYEIKVEVFMQSNVFLNSKANPTAFLQTQVTTVINNSKIFIPSDEKWTYISEYLK